MTRGNHSFSRALAMAAFLASVATCIYFVLAEKAHPHSWYPTECCSGRDCAEIPDTSVLEGAEGFDIVVLPGEHPMVKDGPANFFVRFGDERLSHDGLTHICISPDLKLICFFTPSKGV